MIWHEHEIRNIFRVLYSASNLFCLSAYGLQHFHYWYCFIKSNISARSNDVRQVTQYMTLYRMTEMRKFLYEGRSNVLTVHDMREWLYNENITVIMNCILYFDKWKILLSIVVFCIHSTSKCMLVFLLVMILGSSIWNCSWMSTY